MLRSLVFLCAAAASSAAVAAQGVAFDGRDYRLAQVEVHGPEVINQYLPLRGTQDPWGPTLAVRAFKGKTSTDEVVAAYLKEIRSTLVDEPITMTHNEATDDVVLMMFRKTSDKNVVEYDLERFVRAKDGVVSYRFAQRLPSDADVTPMLTRQPQRIQQLFGMNVAVQDAL